MQFRSIPTITATARLIAGLVIPATNLKLIQQHWMFRLFEYAQKKTTEAGQMIQAWALAGRLTPEGRLMAFERKYNKLQGDAIDKIDPTGEKRRLWREAQELDNEARRKAEDYLENGDNEEYQNLRKKAEAKDKKILDGERKVSDAEFENEKLTNEIADLEAKLKAKTEEKQNILSDVSQKPTPTDGDALP